MTNEEKEYVRYRRERTQAALDVTRLALEKGHVQDAVNRLYYACFYIVSALLLTEGMSSSKHAGIRALFNQHWIKPGRLPLSHGRFYQALFERRQEGDYLDGVAFSPEDVWLWFEEARQFIACISECIDKNLQ